MRNTELYELYRSYNPDEDPSGAYGIKIIDMIIKKEGSLEKMNKWLMLQRLNKLETEAVA